MTHPNSMNSPFNEKLFGVRAHCLQGIHRHLNNTVQTMGTDAEQFFIKWEVQQNWVCHKIGIFG